MLVDIHLKSSRSEGVDADLSRVLREAKEAGLDAVAFCETLSSAHCKEAIAEAESLGLKAFVGIEIPTDHGVLIGFTPQIDDFLLNEEWRQVTDLMTPSASYIVELFAERGGAVIASRPYDLEIPHTMGDLIFNLDGIHGVEVYNSRVGQLQSDFALEAARFLGLPTAGGTDPANGKATVGTYATFFEGDLETQADFVEALKANEYWAVQLGDVEEQKSSRSRRESRGGRKNSRGGRRNSRGGGRKNSRGGRKSSRGGRKSSRGGRRGGRGGGSRR